MKKIYSVPRIQRVEFKNESVICWSNGDGRPADIPAFYRNWEEEEEDN